MDDMVCPDCGAHVKYGHNGCRKLWDEFSVRVLSDTRLVPLRDMAFDTYCMQHLERYCTSPKSYMAHLTRLCCWLEFKGDGRVLDGIRRSLDGTVRLPIPKPPAPHWTLTVADIIAVKDTEPCMKLIRQWAEDVWQTYADQHLPAREWIRMNRN